MYDLSRSRKKWGFNYLALFVAVSVVVLISYLLFLGLYNQSRQGYDTRIDPDSFVEAQDKESSSNNSESNNNNADDNETNIRGQKPTDTILE